MNSFEYANENQIKNFRPIPFYFITTTDPNELSYEAVRESMMTLKEEGFGGIVLFQLLTIRERVAHLFTQGVIAVAGGIVGDGAEFSQITYLMFHKSKVL